MKILLRCLPLFFIAFTSFVHSSKRLEIAPDHSYIVRRVIDGDTFVIEDGSSKGTKVRFIGIDAPESRNTGRKLIGYFGAESKKYLTERLKNRHVSLTFDVAKRDRYGRLLAYVYIDSVLLNAELVEKGYAVTMTVPPNVKYAAYFRELEGKARLHKAGLWK
ncbi:thermonuclease family protein [Sphingobacterium spiritivorum]|uniref:thermonuclease family protein n=1 Tax=Sphingobacterium spiritivorum TaxID=258 RepID=UPI00191AE306|nr:thermonuclease family protein [Sphingobacterium spiritivorum]QQT26566.1 thermonuclease family protein [Sphingobacterium spiritivorum]